MKERQKTVKRNNIPQKHLPWLDDIMGSEAVKITVYALGEIMNGVWTKAQSADLDRRFLEQETNFNKKIDEVKKEVNQRINNLEKKVDDGFKTIMAVFKKNNML